MEAIFYVTGCTFFVLAAPMLISISTSLSSIAKSIASSAGEQARE